ncbi:putative reverse transcriptase domain-containing protein [Tanacetum coccineum]
MQGNALTWWNSHVKTTTPEAAHAMPWRILKKMMTDKYCPRGEIKKLEFEMWNLKVKGTDVVTDRMFPEEIDQVEKYVGGLPDMIHGSVMAKFVISRALISSPSSKATSDLKGTEDNSRSLL